MNDFVKRISSVGITEKSKNPASVQLLESIEEYLNIKLGSQMCSYLLEYGYLAFGYIEFNGANEKQKLRSDIVINSGYVHEHYPETRGFIVLEDRGEEDFILCDSQDAVYSFTPAASRGIRKMNLYLVDYIIERYNQIKSTQ
jgi:hypothetical protein